MCVAQKQHCTSSWERQSHREVWWWQQHHAFRLFIFSWKRGLRQGEGNCDQFHTISHFWHETFRLGKLRKEKNVTFQPYKDSTHSSKSTEMCLHNRKIKVFEWPSQIPVMNPAKHLWGWTEGGFTEEAFAVWQILSAFAKTSGQKLPILHVLLQ